MHRIIGIVVFCAVAAPSALAEPPATHEDELGVLNPQDTGKAMLTRKIEMGVIESITCSSGINVTKYDDPALSGKLTRRCAEAGFAKAMTWMSHLEDNGLGGAYDPEASADWDRRAAETGDPEGRFNHGMNLMRGHGIAQDEVLGRSFVDQAARDGLEIARRLQDSGYDLDAVTPDADTWKYGPMF